jgi:hypothetical protein
LKAIVNLIGTLIALLLIALLTVLLLVPETVVEVLGRLREVQFPLRLALVLVIYLIALVIFSIRLRLTPRGKSDALTVRTSDSVASVTVESVRERVLKTVSEVPGVASVAAQVKSVGGRADIDLNVTTSDDKLNIPEKQREISRVLDQVIKKQLGLQMVGRPRINIQLGRPEAPKPVAPPLSSVPSEPVRAAPPPVIESARDFTPPTSTPVIVPEPVVTAPSPATIPPASETPVESRGLFERFGLGESKSDLPEIPAPIEADDEEEDAFYAMLESERSESPSSDATTVIVDDSVKSEEDQDEDRKF